MFLLFTPVLQNNTYMKVWANVDTEWKYSKSHYQVAKTTQVPNVPISTEPSYPHIMSVQVQQ